MARWLSRMLRTARASRPVETPPYARRAAAVVGALLLLAAGAGELAARQMQDGAARALAAVPVEDGQIRVDGVLDEDAWLHAPVATGFTQRDPADGAPATERTEVRVAFSSSALYVAVRAYDSAPDGIRARLARRDAISDSDEVAVFLDTYHDRRTSFELAVTPRGSIRDVYRADNSFGGGDPSWDPVWEVATSIDELGWSAEFRIPFTQLRYDADAGTWGFQVRRRIERKAEDVWWAPFSRATSGFASQFGTLDGLSGLPSPLRLEVRPYVVSSGRVRPEGTGSLYAPATQVDFDAGLDLKAGITSDFTIDLAVNPDFGQVEADPSVVNLTAFETFFPERRPFFVEGSGLFEQWVPGGQLFYSRRIGRPPQGGAAPPPGGTVERPDAARILGAAKVTGKSGGGLGLGVMSAVTAATDATLRDADGAITGRAPIEPLTHYLAGRAEQDFAAGSHTLGTMVTAVNRRLGDDFEFLRSASYVAGVDGRHRWRNNEYRLDWSLAVSRIEGGAAAITAAQRSALRYYQRPDADHVVLDTTRTALAGTAFSVSAWKQAGTWRYNVAYERASPGFDIGDMGFQWSGDFQSLSAGAAYVRSQPLGVFRNFRIGPNIQTGWTTGGEATGTWVRPVFATATFRNNWSVDFNPLAVMFDQFSPHLLRGGPGLREDTWHNSFLNLRTDGRRPVSLVLFTNMGGVLGTPASFGSLNATLNVRPTNVLRGSIGLSYSANRNPTQWVGRRVVADSAYYLLGTIDQRTVGMRTRVDWTMSPTLSVQFYGQPFVSAGRYDDFKRVRAPRAARFDERFVPLGDAVRCADGQCAVDLTGDGGTDASFARPDFSVRQMRATGIVRWEYRPGSVLFVAWQHARADFLRDGRFRAVRDLSDLFSLATDNTLVIKLNYWLSF